MKSAGSRSEKECGVLKGDSNAGKCPKPDVVQPLYDLLRVDGIKYTLVLQMYQKTVRYVTIRTI